MERKRPNTKHVMLRIDLVIAGILALAVALFAVLYSGGGVGILTSAATGNEVEPDPFPYARAGFYGRTSDPLSGKRPLGLQEYRRAGCSRPSLHRCLRV